MPGLAGSALPRRPTPRDHDRSSRHRKPGSAAGSPRL